MTIRVLVADDQEIFRTGLAMMLDAQPGIEVVGEAADGQEAVRSAMTTCSHETRTGHCRGHPVLARRPG